MSRRYEFQFASWTRRIAWIPTCGSMRLQNSPTVVLLVEFAPSCQRTVESGLDSITSFLPALGRCGTGGKSLTRKGTACYTDRPELCAHPGLRSCIHSLIKKPVRGLPRCPRAPSRCGRSGPHSNRNHQIYRSWCVHASFFSTLGRDPTNSVSRRCCRSADLQRQSPLDRPVSGRDLYLPWRQRPPISRR